MIRRIYIEKGSKIFFGDSEKTRELNLVCKDATFLGKSGNQIAIDSCGKITNLPLDHFFEEDEEGIFFEV